MLRVVSRIWPFLLPQVKIELFKIPNPKYGSTFLPHSEFKKVLVFLNDLRDLIVFDNQIDSCSETGILG